MRRRSPRQGGFTLLELLIAIALFALLGVGTYRMLDAVLRADQTSRTQELELRQLSRAVWALERDLLQAAPRAIRDRFGDERNALYRDSEQPRQAAVEFTRAGWRNPTGEVRATLQRVRWQLDGDRLQRQYWSVLDRDVGSQPRSQEVLRGVRELNWRFLDAGGSWHEQWPPADDQRMDPALAAARMPQAVEVTLLHERHGQIVRLLRLPDGNAPPLRRFEGLPEGVTP